MKISSLHLVILALAALDAGFQSSLRAGPAFVPGDWSVRCWNAETRLWEDRGLTEMTVSKEAGATRITNSSGIHRHAHLVRPAVPEGDFTLTIELRGGYELGFLNAAGKDEMLYLELSEKGEGVAARIPLGEQDFHTYELSRLGTRFTIRRDGRPVPLVHFQFDYGEAFVITLAVKEGESVDIRAVR